VAGELIVTDAIDVGGIAVAAVLLVVAVIFQVVAVRKGPGNEGRETRMSIKRVLLGSSLAVVSEFCISIATTAASCGTSRL
jgi:hypothetical protein